MTSRLVVRPFRVEDQDAARALILAGLAEHFGCLDDGLNHDLRDIAASYSGATFLVAERDGDIVGTGCLVFDDGSARIVRMSTAKQARRTGVGTAVLQALIDAARAVGHESVSLTKHPACDDAISFYRANGFREIELRGPQSLAFERRI